MSNTWLKVGELFKPSPGSEKTPSLLKSHALNETPVELFMILIVRLLISISYVLFVSGRKFAFPNKIC